MIEYTVHQYLNGAWEVRDGVRVCVAGLVSKEQAENIVKELEWAQSNGERSTD